MLSLFSMLLLGLIEVGETFYPLHDCSVVWHAIRRGLAYRRATEALETKLRRSARSDCGPRESISMTCGGTNCEL